MSDLPKVFVASSVEGLQVAEAINIKLEYEAKVKQWDNAFDLSSITITSLIDRAKETEFGVFVFHKDDKTTIRGNEYSVVRDNVLFELGLFIGALGIENCFILIPKSIEGDFRMPTDLSGVTTTTYDDELEDMVDAVATSCAKIKQAMRKSRQGKSEEITVPANNPIDILQKQLSAAHSNIWRMNHELESAKEDASKLLSTLNSYFHSVAKPATESEILKWEEGAKSSYPNEPKISRHNTFFIDKNIVIPPLYGVGSVSIIVAEGVVVHGLDKRSHNSVYFMDGFRKSE
jgi:hypothetical protein